MINLEKRQKISNILEYFKARHTMLSVEFLIEINKVGAAMFRRIRNEVRKYNVLTLENLTPSRSELERVAKLESSHARKTHKFAIDQHLLIMAVCMGWPTRQQEAIGGIDAYYQYMNSAIEYEWRYKPSSAVWDYVTNPKLDIKMREIVNDAIINKKSLLDTVDELELFLGVSQSYPRWLLSRLNSITPPRKNKTKGLISRPVSINNVPRSFAYNAYRLYNTELGNYLVGIQKETYKSNPYVSFVKVRLSPYHSDCDACKEASLRRYKPENGPLLIHPNCLCSYEPVISDTSMDKLERTDYLHEGLNPLIVASSIYAYYKYLEF